MTGEPEILEPEVLPPEKEPGSSHKHSRDSSERSDRAPLNAILCGLILDLVDLVTLSPPLGFALGAFVGYQLARQAASTVPMSIVTGIAAGFYCASPMTNLFPLGTMIGLVIWATGSKRA